MNSRNLVETFLVRFGLAVICLVTVLVAGCQSVSSPIFTVGVSSFVRPGAETKRTYVLLSAEQGRNTEDLEFVEFAAHVERALGSHGFPKADGFASADLAIFIAFGIGAPEEHSYTYHLPVWGQTGVASSTTSGNVSVYGKTGTHSQTTTNIPQYGVTGYTAQQGSFTTFSRHASLTAYDLVEFRENKKEKVVWETRMASAGSSGDLRQVFPVMIAAGRSYIGVSSGKSIQVDLREDDVRDLDVKGLPIPQGKVKTKKERIPHTGSVP